MENQINYGGDLWQDLSVMQKATSGVARQYGGTGLGLPITKCFAELLDTLED